MATERVDRLNSLLKEVISEVIRKEVRNPLVSELVTVTSVSITKDLRYAKVYISVIGTDLEKKNTLEALQTASGFIAMTASKKIRIRFFPSLTFKLDNSVDKHLRIDELLEDISKERDARD